MDKIDKLEKLIVKACKPLQGMPLALSGGVDSSVLAYFIKPKFVINVESPGGAAYDESEYARMVARHLGITIHVIKASDYSFKDNIEEAIKIVGEPTPHFNTFPLYLLYKVLNDVFKEKDIVIADGPDESMCGYARNLIINYLYDVHHYEAFEPYKPMIAKILPESPVEAYQKLAGSTGNVKGEFNSLVQYMNRFDMEIKRPEMDVMGNKFAKHFGIKIHKPYETKEVDDYMFNLPSELKIHNYEYGKYALRVIANKYLPKEIAWRKVKRGGPIYPVNREMGWDKKEGEFGKKSWMEFQEKILNENK